MQIRLTVYPDSAPEIYTFEENTISLGSAPAGVGHLHLNHSFLQPLHLKIAKENDHYTLINVVNDPFVLLNEMPFGKISIPAGSLLKIHDIPIKLEPSEAQSHQQEEAYRRNHEHADLDEKGQLPQDKKAYKKNNLRSLSKFAEFHGLHTFDD